MTRCTDTQRIPHGARMLYWEAIHRTALGDHTGALRCLDRAVAMAPRYAKAWQEIGNCNLRLGRFWEAVSSYDRALSISPEHQSFSAEGCRAVERDTGNG